MCALDRNECVIVQMPAENDFIARDTAKRRAGAAKRDAAAGVLVIGWQAGEPLLDPMCGSGTFSSRLP